MRTLKRLGRRSGHIYRLEGVKVSSLSFLLYRSITHNLGSYWHQYLIALRAHTSLISANSQIMSSLTGKEAKYVRANTLTGLPESRAQTIRFDKPWTVSQLAGPLMSC
jgi:hypothetical protein